MVDGLIFRVQSRARGSSVWRMGVHLVVVSSVILLNMVQQPGRITFDTKLDMQLNPADLLARSTSLWNADWAIGGLQNQASGYLFPMGPVFLLGELMDIPMWIWERLWSAAVMLLAYEGARRLAARWPGVGPAGAILAGLAYMLSPRVLTTVGSLSGESLPAAVLPWTVLPLVLYLRGQLSGRIAFVLSAATVPLMGGQNATLVFACVIFPALLLATAAGRTLRHRVRDLLGWGALVGVASLWWFVPLVLLGYYSPPFLDFIESAESTAGSTGWLSSLRGANHWVAHFSGGGPVGWSGAYELASSRLLLLTTVLVAAIGLVGLLQRGLWERRVLVSSLVIGMAVLTAGSGGWAGSLFSESWLVALDTWLAPLRNIHKFDPLVRLPLSLGIAAWVTAWAPRLGRSAQAERASRVLKLAGTGLLIAVAAIPAAAGSLRTDDGFEAMPSTWRAAVDHVTDQPGPTRVMVLPGTSFGVQTWGRTIDEPIQVLDPPPWVARAQITVSRAGTLRLLDSVEQAVAEARPQDGLAEALRALGITHVIVRNDLDREATDAPAPAVVHAAMNNLPGAEVSATFGESVDGGPALVVYEVGDDAEPRVDVRDWGGRAVVSGSPEVVPELRAAGLVDEDQAVVLATDGEQTDVVTDSLRRIERNFGRVHESRSGVMTAEDRYRLDRQAHDYLDDAIPEQMTTAEYDGVAQILASTSAGYANILGAVSPEHHPYAAFDQSYLTNWETAPYSRPEGQWVEARFERPTEVSSVSLAFDVSSGVGVTSVRIATENNSVVAEVRADGTVPWVDVEDPAATRLRVTVLAASSPSGRVRLSDVRIADHEVSRSLRLPGEVSSGTAVFMSSEAPRRACLVAGESGEVSCAVSRQRETSEARGFDRIITVTEGGSWRLEGRAIATDGPGLEQLRVPLQDDLVRVDVSSTFGGDPAVTGALAFDGDESTGWTSAPHDPSPTLQLSWGPRRKVTRLSASRSPDHPGQLPEALLVDAGPGTGGPQVVTTSGPRAGEMRTVRTRQLRVTALGAAGPGGVGISELVVRGIMDLQHAPGPSTPTGTVCGFGPVVEVAGRQVQTRLRGTLEDVRTGGQLAVTPCKGADTLVLPRGEHRIRVTNPPGFAVTTLSLSPAAAVVPARSLGAPVVTEWSATERTVEVEADSESVLAVSESFNRGWGATADGEELQPVVLQGWQQGFVLPAGTSGTVQLTYAPQGLFEVALIGGLALAVALMLLAVVMLVAVRRRGRSTAPSPEPADLAGVGGPARTRARDAVVLVALALVSLPLAAGALLGRIVRLRRDSLIWLICAGALVVAALVALGSPSILTPHPGADVITALVVGVVSGRALTRPTRS